MKSFKCLAAAEQFAGDNRSTRPPENQQAGQSLSQVQSLAEDQHAEQHTENRDQIDVTGGLAARMRLSL